MTRSLFLAIGFWLTTALSSAAQVPLIEEAYVNRMLTIATISDEVRKRCDRIEARWVRVANEAFRLERYALGLGYSQDEIQTFLDSREAKARWFRDRDAYLNSNGATRDDPESYCRLGEAEIAANSTIGFLLRLR
jgi:hypothetical protein